ncbi:hypothetical protein [Streptomyces piniterrae]|nr:hypothetical protein [Streptomyces piniterrae]
MTVILSGLVVAGFLTTGAAAAATADIYDPEDQRDQKASASEAREGERIYPGTLADLLNGVLGGRSY